MFFDTTYNIDIISRKSYLKIAKIHIKQFKKAFFIGLKHNVLSNIMLFVINNTFELDVLILI